ncbi:7836_t:CDS:2, partial [Entrophospora sp. SA101]
TLEDQQRINEFSKANTKYSDLEETYENKKQEKEYLDDLTNELELLDEEEKIKYKIGDSFIDLPILKVQELIEKDKALLEGELESIKNEFDELKNKMSNLKVHLYRKFGKAINLER